jgi:hypothetical protein
MSVYLDHGLHIVTVFPSVETIDSYGNVIRRPSTVPTEVRCTVSPISSKTFKVITRDAPIDYRSRVIYNGQSCTVDSIHRYDASFETKHVTFIIRSER